MSKCIPVPFGFITIAEVDFVCPQCGKEYHEEDYYTQLYNSKRGLIYKRCKGCGNNIGITSDIRGDVRVWLKKDEKNFKPISHDNIR